jgi:signal transduction histidine kinase
MRLRAWLRDPAWLAVVLVSAAAAGSIVAMAASRVAIPAERALISTEAWPWTSDGVGVVPEGPVSPFRTGDRVVAVAGRPLADWARASISPPWLLGATPLGPSATFRVMRDGVPIDVSAALEPFPADRLSGAPPALVAFAATALILAVVLLVRRPRATALRLLVLGVTCDVANIVAWETGLQPSDLVQRTPFLYAFGLAPVFAVIFWASLLHVLSVYPTRARWLIRRPSVAVAVYVAPLAALGVGALLAAIPGVGALAWIGRLGTVTAAVISGQILVVLGAVVAGYLRTPAPRRGQVRLVALTLFVAAAADLLLVSGPIALGRMPLAPRATVALLALPVVAALALAVIRDRLFQVDLLASSRARIVAAREEERRRLRRELHDELGPTLAAVGLKIDAARDEVAVGDRDAATAALDEARTEVRAVLAQVRGIARELRPPAIDSLGVVGAIRQQIDALTIAGGPRVDVDADVPPALPAAVEVAAYRVVIEAVSNVLRHADARRATVRLWMDHDLLRIEVADDGVGLEGSAIGVGMRAMYERIAEVGGELTIEAAVGGGSVVRASLPVAKPRVAGESAAPAATLQPGRAVEGAE